MKFMKKKSLTTFSLAIVIFSISLLIFSCGIFGTSSSQQISKDSELKNLRTSASDCGIVICNVDEPQIYPKICRSGAGDAIIAWTDYREGSDQIDIYAQKVSSNGNIYWLDNGIMILNSTETNQWLQMCSDGMGGAIMTWNQDIPYSESSIRAQRIDSNGNILWNSSGVIVSYADNSSIGVPQICSDGVDGANIVWHNMDSFSIHAQRIDANGDLLWPANGKTVCLANCSHNFRICSDGSGGVIITWADSRHYATNEWDIYAQRIDSNGNLMWGTHNGIAICNTIDYQYSPQICTDGAGGAIITWQDIRKGEYAQRVDSAGNYLWGNNGSRFCENGGYDISIKSDGQNGAIIAFVTTEQEIPMIYAQKIDSNNNRLWGINGTIIYTGVYMDNFPDYPQICTDQGAAIISWQVKNYNTGTYEIYAQKIDAIGSLRWGTNGVIICDKISYTVLGPFPELCNDGSGGAFIIWMLMVSPSFDIHAQRITSDGSFPWTDDNTGIPFGSVYIFWIIISVISLILVVKRKNLKYLNKN